MKSFLITAALFLGVCTVYLFLMLSGTENHFTYILDDAYIHLAIAKNFALHGVWGVTPYSFSSTSSSPVFTVILSGLIYIFGNHELIPLFFNVAMTFLMVWLLDTYYSDYFNETRSVVAAGFFTMLFTSIPMLVFSGMEHVLQAMVVVVNILCFERWKVSGYKNSYYSGGFYISLALLGLIRFDSMFYFLALTLVLVLLRRFKYAVGVLLYGFTPILIFGYFTCEETGYFFPNSVIIKGSRFDLSGNYFMQIAGLLYHKILDNRNFYFAGLLPLLISAVFIVKDIKKGLSFQRILSRNCLLIVWCITLFLHGAFSKFTKLYRYEVYILMGFAMTVIPKLKPVCEYRNYRLRKNRIISVLIVLSFILLMVKTGLTSYLTVVGSRNIYEQQIQSARFLKKYYPDAKVAANDIGAICYFTDIHLLDFEGLGSKEVVPFRMRSVGIDDKFENFLKSYTAHNGYQLAIAYEEWLQGHTPGNWKKVAVLTVSGSNALLGEDHLYIYSIDPAIHTTLKEQVRNFKWNKNITVKIID